MPVNFNCPYCQQLGTAPDAYAGRPYNCKACSAEIQLPTHEQCQLAELRQVQLETQDQIADLATRGRANPVIAAFLSFLIPGLGQLYKGQFFNSLAWFVCVAIGYLFFWPGLALHFFCVLGAAMPSD